MKLKSLSLIFACSAALALANPAADSLWEKIDAAQKSERPRPEQVDGKSVLTSGYLRAMEERGRNLGDLLMAFVEQYPGDPRRWDAVIALTGNFRPVIKEIGEEVRAKGWEAVVRDEAAEQLWNDRVNGLLEELQAAPAPAGVSERTQQTLFERWVSAARPSLETEAAALAEFRRRIDLLVERYPESRSIRVSEWQYLNRLRKAAPASVGAYLGQLAASAKAEDIRTWAQGELRVEDLRVTPMEMKFTALDGREVDMAKLRGKVVLLDFWATWCGPCIAELPNVKRVYDAYHAQGFEIIAISLDSEKDKQKLIDFVREHELPWPQHYDGLGWKNHYAVHYGITGIPAMFLMDKTGRLATTDARGEKLEAEVKRLLGL